MNEDRVCPKCGACPTCGNQSDLDERWNKAGKEAALALARIEYKTKTGSMVLAEGKVDRLEFIATALTGLAKLIGA